ncbi:hypothetical protein ACTMTJ_00805 [Phytohabitans sp. LJ34]|uniref:hypothetical protein n=1 Tax=Phytohabitans sp. LJ34 TaxID=3452217 RepID=UPI003F88E182
MKAGRRLAIQAAVVGLGLAGLALTVPTFAATKEKPAATTAKNVPAAKQKCCLVELRGPARTVTAGGAPARFDLVVSRSEKGCTQTRRTITVRLGGLAAEHVRVERVVSGQALALRDTSAVAGTVEAVDPLIDSKLICGAETEAAASYRIAFLDGTPLGRAELVVSAHAVNGKLLDSARATTVVVDAVRTSQPPPRTTPPPPVTESPAADETTGAPPAQEQAPPPIDGAGAPPVARPPLKPAAETHPLSTTLLTASIVFALSAMLLMGVLWRLRRAPVPTADEAPTATLPPGVGAELAMLTEDRDAAGPTRPAAP